MNRFPGFYDCGDSGYIDGEGYVHVLGRADDVINVAGHRLDTGQLEEVCRVRWWALQAVFHALRWRPQQSH